MVVLTLGVTLTFSFTGFNTTFADTGQSVHKQHLKEKKEKLHSVKDKQSQASKKIEELENDIADAQKKVNNKQAEVKETQAKIDQIKGKITKAQKRIKKRDKLLKKRVASMYKNGGSIGYIDVLLGSQGFNNFLNRVMALNMISTQDKDLLDKQKKDKEKLDANKDKILEKLDDLQAQMDSLDEIKNNLKKKQREQKDLADDLGDKGKQIKKDIQSIQKDIQTTQFNQSQHHEQKTQKRNNDNQSNKQKSKTDNKTNKQKNHKADATKSTTSSHSSGSVNDIIQASKQYIGNSTYKIGRGRNQADIQNGVFDCSAFVHWAYNQIDVNVGWSTGALASTGTNVSRSSLQPGDMVFFDTYKTNGHVGIYIGNNKFIGAQTSTGVGIANMNNSYWSSKFNHAQRVLN